MKVIVIGAGVVGATTALALAERGLEVVLADRAGRSAGRTLAFLPGSAINASPAHRKRPGTRPIDSIALLPDNAL